MRLEALEVDHPNPEPWPKLSQRRVIPAKWWADRGSNPRWVTVCHLRWWQVWRLLRIRPRRYWPLRLAKEVRGE